MVAMTGDSHLNSSVVSTRRTNEAIPLNSQAVTAQARFGLGTWSVDQAAETDLSRIQARVTGYATRCNGSSLGRVN